MHLLFPSFFKDATSFIAHLNSRKERSRLCSLNAVQIDLKKSLENHYNSFEKYHQSLTKLSKYTHALTKSVPTLMFEIKVSCKSLHCTGQHAPGCLGDREWVSLPFRETQMRKEKDAWLSSLEMSARHFFKGTWATQVSSFNCSDESL